MKKGSFSIFFLFVRCLLVAGILSFTHCQSPVFENPCDTRSNDFLKILFLRAAAKDASSLCGTKVRPFHFPEILSFFVTSPKVSGTIDGENINVVVSFSNVSSLVMSFVHEGEVVLVDGVVQVSGVTSNDFTVTRTYTVIGGDGLQKNYTVTVVQLNPPSLTATRVYGQAGNFTSSNISTTADGLHSPFKPALDSSGLYVADQENNRVLFYPGTSTTATRVYGQGGNFTTANTGSVTDNTFYGVPGANVPDIAVDATGVYVSDIYGSRVLFFPGTSTTATRVYGQNGNFTTVNVGAGADGLANPEGIVTDSTGVYIVDTFNNRILFYPGTSTTATRVYGQSGSFTSNTSNNGGISADSLDNPRGICINEDGVYVADTNNSRVLFYPGISTTATRVYGQNGNFTTNVVGTTASTLSNPWFVSCYAGNVYISDRGNHRILGYEGNATIATRVWGQNGSFTGNAAGLSDKELNDPYGMDIDRTGLYVADGGNNRVLFFPR
ncbi:NHL repeat-containing protein [Leptospira idonii]|uniref:Uncharacterized protein n=1 Tax=Leptospira idonii TaxID=1193500 RepID=A0A4R9LZU3_9LEPT|nr:NHL repeat-containing protein [Leptospira idonii]TGN19903.1 hypothetical protein EHS15_05850 [Leptospira idonii]